MDQLFAEHQLAPPVDNTQHHRLGKLKRQGLYFELADQLEVRFKQAAALVEQLPQALLAKAFSGQFVPQDPDDEPASALLDRLQAEPAAPMKGKRGRKKINSQTPLFS